jgi:rare lipoprotein A
MAAVGMLRASRVPGVPGLALAALLLAACASAPRHPVTWRDDGPPDHAPADLMSTPDAVPRLEPLHPFANRPYAALGRTYVPETAEVPFHQRGVASWYGRQFHGNRTASGERYDMFAMTAAHPTLPIPCYVRVTRVKDGRSVVVRVNDRGPFLKDRIIDLSYAAAARLGLSGPGSGEVELERILPGQLAQASASLPPPAEGSKDKPAALALPSPAPAAEGPGARATNLPAAVSFSVAPPTQDPAAAAPPVPLPPLQDPIAQRATQGAPPLPSPAPPPSAQWSVQLGAFSVPVNADALRDRLALLLSAPEAAGLPAPLRAPRVERAGGLSRVLVGAVSDRALALQWARLLEQFLSRPTTLFSR